MIHPDERDRYRDVHVRVTCIAGYKFRCGTLRHWTKDTAIVRDHGGDWFEAPLEDVEWRTRR